MLDNIQGFHLELTNICTLKCPRCSRTKFIEQFPNKWKNRSIVLEDLQNFIDIPISGKLFRLCGDYGDPIYYEKLFDLVKWIKNNSGRISLHTNGSYKTKAWWEELANLLDKKDTIVFAIDGVPENFTNYRINADWDSILEAINVTTKVAHTVWQYIPFSYNTNSIQQAGELASQLGIAEFNLLPSTRWDSLNDPLRPESQYINVSDKEIKFQQQQTAKQIAPRCKSTNYDHYITAQGFYAPCCHIPNHNFYYKTEFYKNKKSYNISKTTITQVLEELREFYATLETTKPIYCIYNCPKYE